MTDPNNVSNSNEDIVNDSFDESEQNRTVAGTETPEEESTRNVPPQLTTDAEVNDTHQITNQQIDRLIACEFDHDVPPRHAIIPIRYCGIHIRFYWYWLMSILIGFCIGHSWYWLILVLVGLGIRGIGAIPFPVRTFDNILHVRLGHAQPWPLNYNFGLNQNAQAAGGIAHPSDEGQPLVITFTFSNRVQIYHPLPRENSGVEDMQPCDMPTSVSLNNTQRELFMDDENNHVNVDARAHYNPGIRTDMITHNEPNIRVIVRNNAVIQAPNEVSPDTDFSVDTSEHQRDNQVDTVSDEDEQLVTPKTSLHIDDANNLTNRSERRGQASPNTENNNVVVGNTEQSNQTNNIPEQHVPTALTTSSPSPQALDNGRNIADPTGGAYQAAVLPLPPSNMYSPKITIPIGSGDESSEDSTG